MRLFPNNASRRQSSVLSDNDIAKCQDVNCMCVSSWRFATILGPWVKVHSQQCGTGQCGGVVLRSTWSPIGKALRGGDGSFIRLWFGGDWQRSSSGTRETQHQLLTSLHRNLQQNHDTVDTRCWQDDRWAKMSNAYISGLDVTVNQTDAATQPIWTIATFRGIILTFIPMRVERYKCDSSLKQFDLVVVMFLIYRGASLLFSQKNV